MDLIKNLSMVVIVECAAAVVTTLYVVPKLSVEKGLEVVELAKRARYGVAAKKMVVVLGLHMREGLEVGELAMVAECVGMVPKVSVVSKLPIEMGHFLVEQVESSVVPEEKVLEGLEPLVDVECAGEVLLDLEVLGLYAGEGLEVVEC